VREAYGKFDPENPSGTVPALLDIRQMVDKLEDNIRPEISHHPNYVGEYLFLIPNL